MNTDELLQTALHLAKLTTKPYDTDVIVSGDNIKKVLIGIDMETSELLLAKQLGFDCVVSHHPKADNCVVDFAKVMEVQIERMVKAGVPINKAQKALKKQQSRVDLARHASNYDRVSSAAKLLQLPYLNIHIPADFITERIVQKNLINYSKKIKKPHYKILSLPLMSGNIIKTNLQNPLFGWAVQMIMQDVLKCSWQVVPMGE